MPVRIYPGLPWENGYNERFNGTLRREVLNAERFATTRQAQTVINQWLRQYNHVRPYHAVGMRPPVPGTLLENRPLSGTEQGGYAAYLALRRAFSRGISANVTLPSSLPLTWLNSIHPLMPERAP